MTQTISRRQARRAAFVLAYQHDLRPDTPIAELCARHALDTGIAVDPYTLEALDGVVALCGELDAAIDRAATGWTSDRLGAVERAILRLATWELQHGDAPRAVVIDEAIELAKRYASAEASAFINGVLAAIATEIG